MVSSICSAERPESLIAAWMAAAPSCGEVSGLSAPWNAPMGVRRAATM
jgi:hypothetical protein